MSSRKENLHKQADISHQIAKASNAIRRKHKLMKWDKETIEHSLNETFKPIVTPHGKIVGGFETIKKVDPVSEKEQVKIVDTENIDDDNYLSFKSADDEREDSINLELSGVDNTESNMQPYSSSWDDNIKHYLILLGERSKDVDNVYGVQKLTKDRLMFGDSPISFSQD